MPSIEPRAAGWEARVLPLCFDAPIDQPLLDPVIVWSDPYFIFYRSKSICGKKISLLETESNIFVGIANLKKEFLFGYKKSLEN